MLNLLERSHGAHFYISRRHMYWMVDWRRRTTSCSLVAASLTCFVFLSRRVWVEEDSRTTVLQTSSQSPWESQHVSNVRVADAFDTESFEIDGPFDGSAIQAHCETVSWRKNLYIDCSQNTGGLGNIRSFILTCIRYTIDAGASLILPTIQKRKTDNLGDLFSHEYLPFNYLFDEEFFLTSLAQFCPQMNVVRGRRSFPNHENQHFKDDVEPRGMGNHMSNDGQGFDLNRWAGTWREDLDWWLANSYQHVPSSDEPVVLRWKWPTIFDWPIWLDGPRFANTFGRLLRIRPDIAQIAVKILINLHKIDPESTRSLIHQPQLLQYVGIHLRVEEDVLEWWPKEEDQVHEYLTTLRDKQLSPSTVYVATGSQAGFERLKHRLTGEFDIKHVLTKYQVLDGEDLAALKGLSWDQQGLVDYLILMRSEYFMGIMQSTFAQNLAARRHLLQNGSETTIWRGDRDERSLLVGPRREYINHWVFFNHEAMWP